MKKINKNLTDLSNRLQSLREFLFLKPGDIADELGLTRVTYVKLEGQNAELDSSQIFYLCQKFRITPNWLLGYDDNTLFKMQINSDDDILEFENEKVTNGVQKYLSIREIENELSTINDKYIITIKKQVLK